MKVLHWQRARQTQSKGGERKKRQKEIMGERMTYLETEKQRKGSERKEREKDMKSERIRQKQTTDR